MTLMLMVKPMMNDGKANDENGQAWNSPACIASSSSNVFGHIGFNLQGLKNFDNFDNNVSLRHNFQVYFCLTVNQSPCFNLFINAH